MKCARCGCEIMQGQKHEPNGNIDGEDTCYVSQIVPIVRKTPSFLRIGKPTKIPVRRAVDLFLQSPSIETATDAKAAIDRYLSTPRT